MNSSKPNGAVPPNVIPQPNGQVTQQQVIEALGNANFQMLANNTYIAELQAFCARILKENEELRAELAAVEFDHQAGTKEAARVQ